MKRIKLPKDVWVSLYGKLFDTISTLRWNSSVTDDDVRDEVLNIMTLYFDRGFKTGITEETEINVHN
tara:strand:+ start:903 stop:1103 length:201 start_codon:yes stop_codon:yes gene_type:complete